MNNNANIEMLFKLIIPAIFVVLWTLNSLFNKELQNQQKIQRGGSPLGPRPGYPPLAGTGGPERGNDPRDLPRSRPRRNEEEGLVILAGEGPPPWAERAAPTRSSGGGMSKKPARGRGTGRNKVEPAARSRSEIVVPTTLSVPQLAPIQTGYEPAYEAAPSVGTRVQSATSAEELIKKLADPASLRQLIVLREILQPPRSMRMLRPPWR